MARKAKSAAHAPPSARRLAKRAVPARRKGFAATAGCRRGSDGGGGSSPGPHSNVSAGRRRLLPARFSTRRAGGLSHPRSIVASTRRRKRAASASNRWSTIFTSSPRARSISLSARTSTRTTCRASPRLPRSSRTSRQARSGWRGRRTRATPLAKDLRGTKDKALTTLSGARMRMKLAGATGEEERLAARSSASSATARAPGSGSSATPRSSFRRRSSTASRARPPIELLDGQARVLRAAGAAARCPADRPVRTEQVRRSGLRRHSPQIRRLWRTARMRSHRPSTENRWRPSTIALPCPWKAPKALPFFKQRYWSRHQRRESRGAHPTTRRTGGGIDNDWLGSATHIGAANSNEDTNNTSLVLALRTGTEGQGRDLFCCSPRMRKSATGCPGRT